MTCEEIALKYIPCRCDEAYTSRGLTAPDCPYHSTDPESAMEEYAEQQAITFAVWMKGINYVAAQQSPRKLYDKFLEYQNQQQNK